MLQQSQIRTLMFNTQYKTWEVENSLLNINKLTKKVTKSSPEIIKHNQNNMRDEGVGEVARRTTSLTKKRYKGNE